MKILAVGDPHAKTSNVNEIKMLADKIKDNATELSVDRIVVLGDLADSFDKISVYAYRAIEYFFNTLAPVAQVDYIIGNHDLSSNSQFMSDQHFFGPFDALGINIIDKPIVMGEIAFIPYAPPGRFKEALGLLDNPEKIKFIFCHQEFAGASFGHFTSKSGDTWDKNAPMVISGHIHEHSYLQSNILYVGSPYQTNFGESPDKTVSLIEIDFSDNSFKETRIDLGMPKKITINTNSEDFPKKLEDGNQYRIVVSDSEENIIKLKKSKRYKDIQDKAKIIFKITDFITFKKNERNKSFVELLRETASQDSSSVVSVLEEVLRDVSKIN